MAGNGAVPNNGLNHEPAVRPMEYPVLAGGPALGEMSAAGLAARVRELESEREERERRWVRDLEAARREALEQGRIAATSDDAAWRKQCAAELAAAIEEFRARRDEYLAQVEHEVVRLALAVAERILHREAQMDPLLLAGAVRVALGRLAESTEVRLRVPVAQQELWAEMLRLMPALPLCPEVVGDAEMQVTEAQLETTLGRVDLGVRAQIEEIERGFFDLLEVRAKDGRAEVGKRG
jgi:flagellar assembly protein FliH